MVKKYAIVREHHEHHADDGYGDSYTVRFNVIEEFNNIDELKLWVLSNRNVKFKAYELNELNVKTTVEVQVTINE